VPKTTSCATDCYPVSFLGVGFEEGSIDCETRAEHGCCVDGVDICGDGCHVVGLSDGVFSECPGSVVSRSLSQYMKCYDNQVVNV